MRTAPDTFESRTDAGRFLAAIESDMRRGLWSDPKTGDTTLRVYADAWLAERRVRGRSLAPRTVDTYRHSLDMWILPFLGDMPLRTLTPAVVRRWHAEVSESTGTTATRQAYALLRAIFNTAIADDAIARNPCRIRGAGQPHTPERPLIDPADVARAAAAMPAGLEATVLLALWAHLRIGEVLGLERGDIGRRARHELSGAHAVVERERHPLEVFVETAPEVVRDERGAAMTWASQVDYVSVVLFDEAVQMYIDEVQPRSGSEVTEQTRLDVLRLERLAEERIVEQVDLTDRQVVGRPPIAVERVDLSRCEVWHVSDPRPISHSRGNGLHDLGHPHDEDGAACACEHAP